MTLLDFIHPHSSQAPLTTAADAEPTVTSVPVKEMEAAPKVPPKTDSPVSETGEVAPADVAEKTVCSRRVANRRPFEKD